MLVKHLAECVLGIRKKGSWEAFGEESLRTAGSMHGKVQMVEMQTSLSWEDEW